MTRTRPNVRNSVHVSRLSDHHSSIASSDHEMSPAHAGGMEEHTDFSGSEGQQPESATTPIIREPEDWWLRKSCIMRVNLEEDQHTYRFGLLGIFNTKPEHAMYQVIAEVCGKSYDFNQVDWQRTTTTQYRFIKSQDILVSPEKGTLMPNSSIVYRVIKYDTGSKKVDPNFAFAVQNLTTKQRDN